MLSVVATPIGNLQDITLRALETLRAADLIVCEDSRVVKKLLFKHGIEGKTLLAIAEHSDESKLRRVLDALADGKAVALVSDAGTPGLSDPGNKLVRMAAEAGHIVSPVPGPSALAALVSIAGINMQAFVFKGFPPHKKGRETYFREVAASPVPVVYYESPHRVMKNLELLASLNPVARVVIGRELTKVFEEVIRGTVGDALAYFTEHPDKVKGEFAVLVESVVKQ